MERSVSMSAGAALRFAAALAISAGSFLALRHAFPEDCWISTYDSLRLILFPALPLSFILGSVWLVSEPAYQLVLVW